MKKSLFGVFTLAVVCMFVFLSCQKEDKTFKLTTQKYAGASDSKAYIEDNYACWSDGDSIIINATPAKVSLSVSNSNYVATVSGIPQNNNGYYALYPASYCDEPSFTDGSTITLPAKITYVEESGSQVIMAPMAAKADENTILNFKNLCTLLKVHFDSTNNIVKTISIYSKGTEHIVGSASVVFNGQNPALDSISEGGKTLTLDCGSGVNIKNGKDFYLPIPPLTRGQVLKLEVTSKFGDSASYDLTVKNPLPANAIIEVKAPKLPPNNTYVFYDWIQSRSSGYIDLGVSPDNSMKLELTFSIYDDAAAAATQYLSGSREGTGIQWFSLGGSYTTNYFHARFCDALAVNSPANGGWTRQAGVIYRETMEIQGNGSGAYRGHVVFENLSTGGRNVVNTAYVNGGITGSNIPHIYLFSVGNDCHTGMRCYRYRLWSDKDHNGVSELVHDFIPAIYNGVVGVYDMVGDGGFIAPMRTGTKPFGVGNDPK